jgi:hypothetical protein
MITIQHTEEQLSRAYVTAVAGYAGINLMAERSHDYGVDGNCTDGIALPVIIAV